jgi:hypothetical protein
MVHIGGYYTIRAGELEPKPHGDSAEDWDNYSTAWGDTDVKAHGLGLALKFVSHTAPRLFLGFGMDVGLHMLQFEDWEDVRDPFTGDRYFEESTLIGIELAARMAIDIVALDTGSFKLIIPIGVGLTAVPFAARTIIEEDEDQGQPEIKPRVWYLTPVITAGIAIGG